MNSSCSKIQRVKSHPSRRNYQSRLSEMSSLAVKTIAAALDATAIKFPQSLAVLSPFQDHPKLTYDDFRRKTTGLAGFLNAYGFERKDVLVSDLPNVTENLILQIACNRLGITYATVKNLEGMAKLPKVRGAVSAVGIGFLAETNLPLPYLSGEFLVDLVHNGGLDEFQFEDDEQDGSDPAAMMVPHAFYNNVSPFTNEEALRLGKDAAWELAMSEEDVMCISITLCHAFGMGSAVSSAIQTGCTIVLPAVGGIQGCGVPSQRAQATLDVLESEKCTLLFADTHTLKALPDDHPERLNLRGGVCKVGSGSQFLEETVKYGGINFKTMGKAGQ